MTSLHMFRWYPVTDESVTLIGLDGQRQGCLTLALWQRRKRLTWVATVASTLADSKVHGPCAVNTGRETRLVKTGVIVDTCVHWT